MSNLRLIFSGGGTHEQAGRSVPEKPKGYPEFSMFGSLPAYGFYCRHVAGLRFANVRTAFAEPDIRSALFCEDVDGLEVSSASFAAVRHSSPSIVLRDAKNVMIQGCRAYSLPAFLSVMGSRSQDIAVLGNDLHLTTRAVVTGKDVNSEAVFVAGNHEPKRADE